MGKPKRVRKRGYYILLCVLFGLFFVGAATASMTCWAVFYKPFDEFVRVDMQGVMGENLEFLDNNNYVVSFEVDGVVYEIRRRRRGGFGFPSELSFHYLKSDPSYTLFDRTAMLIVLPAVSAVLLLVYAVAVSNCRKGIRQAALNERKNKTFAGS